MYHFYGDQPRLQLALRRYSLQGPGARGMSLLETSSSLDKFTCDHLFSSELDCILQLHVRMESCLGWLLGVIVMGPQLFLGFLIL